MKKMPTARKLYWYMHHKIAHITCKFLKN